MVQTVINKAVISRESARLINAMLLIEEAAKMALRRIDLSGKKGLIDEAYYQRQRTVLFDLVDQKLDALADAADWQQEELLIEDARSFFLEFFSSGKSYLFSH